MSTCYIIKIVQVKKINDNGKQKNHYNMILNDQ